MRIGCKTLFLLGLPLVFLLAGCTSSGKKGTGATNDTNAVTAPKVTEFILGSGDTVDISVFNEDNLHTSAKIDASGTLMLPLIGDVQIAGRSIYALRDEIQERLAKYVVKPQVMIRVTDVQSQKIFVLGEVRTPGAFVLDSGQTLVEAIAKAGGVTADAKTSNILLIHRGKGKEKERVTSVSLRQVLKKEEVAYTPLQGGDIVYVPQSTISKVSNYMVYLSHIINPIVTLENGIVLWPQAKDVVTGASEETTSDSTLSIPTHSTAD